MAEPLSPSPAVPAWICKRDGRLVPFEADKISRALFAAGERLGRPDPFLSRELTDAVVHFLAAEVDGGTPSTAQVAELVVKVVRELGQPALAATFAEEHQAREHKPKPPPDVALEGPEVLVRFSTAVPLPTVLRTCVRRYALHAVFARDLIAAQAEGLLTLTGLEAPFELAGCVLRLAGPGQGLMEAVEGIRQLAGGFVALDGPEHALAHGAGETAVAEFVRELGISLRAFGLAAVVNLNCAAPPPWADDLAEGPLFAAARPEPDRLAAGCDALLDLLLRPGQDRVRIDWHLGERDFAAGNGERLRAVARRAVEGAPLAFTFDRPRRSVPLAEGIDRQHPAVLLTVGLHLPRLARQAGVAGNPAAFVQKLGSLARLALSAAVQKRDFLRRHRPAVSRGFLLDRARVVVAPIGLEWAAQAFFGRGLAAGGETLEFGRQVVQRLRDVLGQDGPGCRLNACVDAPLGWLPAEAEADGAAVWPTAGARTPELEQITGLTAWDHTATERAQLRAAGALHAAEQGTAAVLVPPERLPTPDEAAAWLRWAWSRTDVVRLRFVRAAAPPQQLTVPWPE